MKKMTNKIMSALGHVLLITCLCGPVFGEDAFSNKNGKILILNSDMAVEQYVLAQSKFKSLSASKIIDEIDLGSKSIDEAGIKSTIFEKNPDIIYCIGTKAYMLAHKLSKNKKIIFSSAINWRRLPMGKNTYGISYELLSGMQLMMYRYFFPELKKIGVIYSKYNKEWLKGAVKDGRNTGIDIIGKQVKKPADIARALKELLPGVDALWLTSDPVVISSEELVAEIFKQTRSLKKPVFAYSEIFARLGALLIISADVPTMGMQAAGLADDLLAGHEIPERVVNPAGSHITLNMKKVKEYGVDLNKEAMDSVNRIIQ